MHEVRATIPVECVAEAARLAHQARIERVTIGDVFVCGPDVQRRQLTVDTSTPKACAFVDAFLTSSALSKSDYTLTTREVRAIVNTQSRAQITDPMREPFPDVMQDLWQLSHVTVSYIARATAGAILLATGVIENDPVAIVVAAMFLPFLAEVLAMSFGIWSRDGLLVLQGIRAILTSTGIALAAGAASGVVERWTHRLPRISRPSHQLYNCRRPVERGRYRPALLDRCCGSHPIFHLPGLARSRLRSRCASSPGSLLALVNVRH